MGFAIQVKSLFARYDGNFVLNDVNFEVPLGKICGVIGPNGAGKSTMLKAVLGVIKSEGEVLFFDEKFEKTRLRVAYLPQREQIDWDFPVTVDDVVLMGRTPRKKFYERLNAHDRETANNALKQVGMIDFAAKRISDLSGGQQKRVFLARALAQEADLYLLDEPFAGIDAVSEKAVMDILRSLAESGKTILMVHHDLQTVREYFNYIILLNKTVISHGVCENVFKQDLIEETYGLKSAFSK